MGAKEFFSTGDVSQLLNISRATVSRKFDAGIFRGKKNSITGERLISLESLIAFMRQYNIPLKDLDKSTLKHIIICSQDEKLQILVNNALSDDKRFKLSIVTSGYDALIMCSKSPPDLFIIDEELTDISCPNAVNSLKRQFEKDNVRILCCLKTLDENKFTEINADDYLIKDTMDISSLMRKISHLLNIEIGTQLLETKFDHMRQWPRIPVNIPAGLEVYRIDTPHLREPGKSLVENISLSGAYISQILVESGNIPSYTFRFLLDIDHPPLNDWQAECKAVRLQSNGSLTAGIQFVNISQQNRNKIAHMFI